MIADLEIFDNSGMVTVILITGKTIKIPVSKEPHQRFRLGGTAINQLQIREAILVNKKNDLIRIFIDECNCVDKISVISDERWHNGDGGFAIEFYSIEMEGKPSAWFLSKNTPLNPENLFVNLDVIDGGDNIIMRYRISRFTGEWRIINDF